MRPFVVPLIVAVLLSVAIWQFDFIEPLAPIDDVAQQPEQPPIPERAPLKEQPQPQPQPPPPSAPSPKIIARLGEVEVPIKIAGVPRERLPEELHHASFAELEQAAAAGDDAAAYSLHHALQSCESMPKTAEELRAAEDKARAQYAAIGGIVEGESVSLDDVLGFWRSGYERCAGVEASMYERAVELVRESAERGDFANELLYAQLLRKTDPEAARARLEALATDGSALAMHALGYESLPHRLAFIAFDSAWTRRPEVIARYQDEYREIENSTSPPVFREAVQEAVRLLSSPNCCKL